MLNLETARYDADARDKQKEYLTEVVNEAKSRNQWTLVGFHKSIYTGASHIRRFRYNRSKKYWHSIFYRIRCRYSNARIMITIFKRFCKFRWI